MANSLGTISQSIKKKLREHFSIMVIPHSEKQIFSFQISNSVILFLVTLLAIFGFTIFVYNSNQQELTSTIKTSATEDSSWNEQFKRYRRVIQDHNKSFQIYSDELNKILKLFGETSPADSLSKKDLQESITHLSEKYNINENEIPIDAAQLFTLTKLLINSSEKISDVELVLRNRKKILGSIPSEWPIKDHAGYKTSPFGVRFSPFLGKKTFHTGVDIAARAGTIVVSAADGTVAAAEFQSGYGNIVIINHDYGYKTMYGHNQAMLVRSGSVVKKGQPIALVGRSGRATGYHLHFELRINNEPVDPWPYITTEF